MALVEIYTAGFTSSNGYTYEIAIMEDGGTATGATFEVGSSGFILNTTANDEDKFDPIIASDVSIPFYVRNITDETFINTLAASQEEKYYVKIYKIEAGILRYPIFYGIILQDLITIEDICYPYEVNITAIDGLARLKDIDYSNAGAEYTTKASLLTIARTVLLKTGTADMWGATDTYMGTAVEWHEKNTYTGSPATTLDPLAVTRVSQKVFSNKDEDGTTFTSAYDVLKQILIRFGARIQQFNGRWYVTSISNYADVTTGKVWVLYRKTGGAVTTQNVSAWYALESNYFKRLEGNTFNYLPAFTKALTEYNYRYSEWPNSFIPFNGPFPTTYYTDISGGAGEKLEAEGIVNINYTGSSSNQFKVRFRVRLYVGGNWIQGENNTVAWVATTNVNYYLYSNPINSGSHSVDFSFITPPIPADGGLNFGFELDGYYDLNGNVLTSTPSSISYSYQARVGYQNAAGNSGEGIRRSRALNYVAGTTTQVDSRYVYNTEQLVLSDAEFIFDVGGLEVINDTTGLWQDSEEWSKDGETTYTSIDKLLVQEIVAAQRTPLVLYDMTVYISNNSISWLFFVYQWASLKMTDGLILQPMTTSFNANRDEITGTWVQANRISTDIGLGDELLDVETLQLNQQTGVNSITLASRANWLLLAKTAQISTTIASGATETAIDIYAPVHETIKAGDTIYLVDTFDNFSEALTVASDVGSTDTSINISSHTFSRSFYVNSYVVFSHAEIIRKAHVDNVKRVTAGYSMTVYDRVIIANSATAIVIPLPSAAVVEGIDLTIKSVGVGIVSVRSSDLIETQSGIDLVQGESITVVSDGTTYWIV